MQVGGICPHWVTLALASHWAYQINVVCLLFDPTRTRLWREYGGKKQTSFFLASGDVDNTDKKLLKVASAFVH